MNTTRKNNILEIIIFGIFCVFALILSLYHEPWFDELQAWAISKESLKNILFFVPHYEGHPQLWHLILKCFSNFNVPVEVGIRIPNLLFMFATVYLLIFKSPFPNVVRYSLPFTYFIFYQYTVINRPYCIFCFALMLCALMHKTRNSHPFKYILSLILLSLSSAYGMILTAGICIAWFIEILKEKELIVSLKNLFKDSRFYSMCLAAILCLILAVSMKPANNAFATFEEVQIDYLSKFFSAFFLFPADATLTNFFNYVSIDIFDVDFKHFFEHFENQDINSFILKFWFYCFVGLIINILLFNFFKSAKKFIFFTVPYLLFLTAIFLLYGHVHHVGLITIFLIYAFWCVYADGGIVLTPKFEKIFSFFILITIVTQLYWTLCSSYYEYKYSYSAVREVSKFIKKYDLLKYRAIGGWATCTALINKKTNKRHISHIADPNRINWYSDKEFLKEYYMKDFSFFNHQHLSVGLNALFDENLFYNFNPFYPHRLYLFHIVMNEDEVKQEKEYVKEKGLPDVLVGETSLDLIFDEYGVLAKNYRMMDSFRWSYIIKNKMYDNETPIYMRKDLYYEWVKKNLTL